LLSIFCAKELSNDRAAGGPLAIDQYAETALGLLFKQAVQHWWDGGQLGVDLTL
jgi:hypothetical protein